MKGVVVRVDQVLQYVFVSVGVLVNEIPPHLSFKDNGYILHIPKKCKFFNSFAM